MRQSGIWLMLVSFGFSWNAAAQGTQPRVVDRTLRNAAESKWELMQYQEAFDLYEVVTYSQMERAKRKGKPYAPELLDRVVECGLLAGRRLELAALLDSARTWGYASLDHNEILEQLTLALSGTASSKSYLSQAWVIPLRPESDDPEYCAVPNGDQFLFVRERSVFGMGADGWTGRKYGEVVQAPLAEPFAEPAVLEEWSKFHDGPVAFGKKGDWMLVTMSHDEEVEVEGELVRNLKLAVFERRPNGVWVELKTFPYNNPEYSVAHGAMDSEGNLYFSSDMPGGQGGMDLWRCAAEGRRFGTLENLGPAINTASNEVFPFVGPDGTLYFSSAGHPGIGGMDLFAWKDHELTHLPQPVNSAWDDFAIHLDEWGIGFMSSDRDQGMDRIYTLEMRDQTVDLTYRLVTCDEGPLAGEELRVYNRKTRENTTLSTDLKGALALQVVVGDTLDIAFNGGECFNPTLRTWVAELGMESADLADTLAYREREHQVTVAFADTGNDKDSVAVTFLCEGQPQEVILVGQNDTFSWGFHDRDLCSQLVVDAIGYRSQSLDLALNPLCPRPWDVDVVLELAYDINLDQVYYGLGDAQFDRTSRHVLDEVVAYMKEVPHLTLELSSHTDSRASDAFNLQLSQNRAQSCVDYIVAHGVSASRILAKGFGETRPLNHCTDGVSCTEAEHQLNRRTELHFVGIH